MGKGPKMAREKGCFVFEVCGVGKPRKKFFYKIERRLPKGCFHHKKKQGMGHCQRLIKKKRTRGETSKRGKKTLRRKNRRGVGGRGDGLATVEKGLNA